MEKVQSEFPCLVKSELWTDRLAAITVAKVRLGLAATGPPD